MTPWMRRRGFLFVSGLLAAAQPQGRKRLAQQTDDGGESAVSVADSVTFLDCETVKVEGTFQEVTMEAHTYTPSGFESHSAGFGPVEGTTTLPPEGFGYFSEGISGYLIPVVRLVGEQGEPLGEVENPAEGACYSRIRPDLPTVEFVAAEPSGDGIAATFGVQNPNGGTLSPETTVGVGSGSIAGRPPDTYSAGWTEFTLDWQPEADAERLVVTLDCGQYGYDDGTVSAETPPAGEIQDQEGGFDPEISVECYSVRVDAESYDSVALRFADGTTVTFDAGYSGQVDFGFAGDGAIEAGGATAVGEFHGPIQEATVTSGAASETVGREGDCVFSDLTFDCDAAAYSGASDVRVAFHDGSAKRWDGPADPEQTRFGSPGRVVETITEAAADVTVENPGRDCEPGAYATVFDCNEVRITAAEFETEPTFDLVRLAFADGSSQAFGERGDGPSFTAPETLAGTGDHAGKVIEAVEIEKAGGEVFFRLVNPDVSECESVSG